MGDFFNENICRAGVFRPSNGNWYVRGVEGGVNGGADVVLQFGQAGDIPFIADILKEGKNRLIVWRPSTGVWFVKDLSTASWGSGDCFQMQCGEAADIPLVSHPLPLLGVRP